MASRIATWARVHGKDQAWLDKTITGKWEANSVIDREELFERHRRMWFSTSICYAICDAVEEHMERRVDNPSCKTTIGMWGIDLESDEEHISQHMGCAHFMDLARIVGIDIVLPEGSGLARDLTPYPDRYETHLSHAFEKKQKLLGAMIPQAEAEYENTRLVAGRIEGAIIKMREFEAIGNRVREMAEKTGIILSETARFLAISDPSHPIAQMIGQVTAMAEELKGVHIGSEVMPKADEEMRLAMAKISEAAARVNHLRGELGAVDYFRRMYTWGMIDPTVHIYGDTGENA